ncbi:MAG: hypothetical protein ABSB61_09560 [Anaerolineales bacterium]|jgi:hypothetical protein
MAGILPEPGVRLALSELHEFNGNSSFLPKFLDITPGQGIIHPGMTCVVKDKA